MKNFIFAMALAALWVPDATGQSVFDGTWKLDFSTVKFPPKPVNLLLKDGVYTCKSCDFPFSVKADGTDQPISGDPYRDTLAVTIVSDHEIRETSKKNGKVVATSRICISADGNTETGEFSDSSASNGGAPVTGKFTAKRVGKVLPGLHAISGSWLQEKAEGISDNAALYTFKVTGDQLTMTTPTGQSYTAKLDGTEAPVKGDPGSDSVQVRLLGKNTLEETYLLNGKPQLVYKTVVGPDGKRAVVTSEDKRDNTSTTIESVKQK